MSNVPSFRKSITILLIGAAAGFAGCTPSPPTPPDVCPAGPAVDRVINLSVEGTQIVHIPDEVTVCVLNGDQVVWIWDSEPTEEFAVSLLHEAPPITTPPTNPFPTIFQPTTGPPPLRFEEDSTEGKLASGRAVPAVRGHDFKFTISAISRSDLEPVDPHVRFY